MKDSTRTHDICGATGNPDGAWTFKRLMMDMANTPDEATAARFVENWIQKWENDQVVSVTSNHMDTAPARLAVFLINGRDKMDISTSIKPPFGC